MKSKIRVRKDENGKSFAIITHRLITKDEKKELAARKDELLEKDTTQHIFDEDVYKNLLNFLSLSLIKWDGSLIIK